MKDLRFKIIADFVRDGFAKAEGAVSQLRAKFSEFFSFQRAGWAKTISFGASAGLAIAAAIRSAVNAAKASWMDAMDAMERRTADFSGTTQMLFRKAKNVDTQAEKDKLIEQTRDEMRKLEVDKRRIENEEAWDSPLDSAMEIVERKKNAALGLGPLTNNEKALKQITEELLQYEKILKNIQGLTVRDEAEEERTKAVKEAKAAQIEAAKRKHDIELAWVEEEKQALAEKLDAEKKAAEASAEATRKKIADRRALIDAEREWMEEDKAAQEDLIRLREMGLEVEKAAADVAQAAKNPGRDREISYGEFMDKRRAIADVARRGFRTDEERKKAMDALTSQGAAARAVQVAEQSKKLLEEIRDKLGMAP